MRREERLATIKRGRLSPEEEAEIERLGHLTAAQIALRLNRHPGTINFAMHRLGLKAPVDRDFSYIRGGRRVRSFTRDEDTFIETLRVQAYSTPEIAAIVSKRFGHPRSSHTILIRLKMLANRDQT